MEGLWPADNEVDLRDNEAPRRIYEANTRMIKSCDAIIANIQAFRGPDMDPGTAFELGYSCALYGWRPVVCYGPCDDSLKTRTLKKCETLGEFPIIENFHLTENLMIGEGAWYVTVPGTPEDAIKYLASYFWGYKVEDRKREGNR